MIRFIARQLCLVACVWASTSLLAQTEFSAEIVDLEKQNKDKLRIEQNERGSRGGGAVIVDLASHSSLVLMPQQHMYMEISQEQNTHQMMSLFRTGDVENACSDWLQLAHNRGGTCRKIGNETVNGRSTVKYEGKAANGDVSYVWLDPKLRFPVKWQGAHEQSGELRNIQEGSQPASLFEVPSGYTKMDMGGMMQQRQH